MNKPVEPTREASQLAINKVLKSTGHKFPEMTREDVLIRFLIDNELAKFEHEALMLWTGAKYESWKEAYKS